MLKDIHVKWLLQRGITAETMERFELSSQANLLSLPYHDLEGNVTHAKLRTSDARKYMRIEPKGAPTEFFNSDALSDPTIPLVITEGEMDCMVAAQAGLRAVSVPNGAPAKESQGDIIRDRDTKFKYIWDDDFDLRQELEQTKKFILCGDADEPGQILNNELSVRLGQDKCYVVVYPNGCKDLNDVLLSHGEDKVREVVENARPLVSDNVTRMGDRYIGPVQEGLASGWRPLDQHLKLTFPELVTVSGIPGAGKSQFALAWACNMARLHQVRTCVFQLEDSPERVYRDLVGYAQAWEINNPKGWVAEYFCEMKRDDRREEDLTLEWLKVSIKQAVMRFGCKMVILDPWNEIEHIWDKGQSETQYTNNALRELKKLGRQLKIAIVIVAHPSMAVKNKKSEDMTMYDVAGSAAWYNKSDHGVIVSRCEQGLTRVDVQKCKDHSRMGWPGAVEMKFDVTKRIFKDARKA